jgi:dTDP-4-amino-4,6-dideoxygalactose transaminase
MASWRIPFNRPTLAGNELAYITEAVLANWHSAGDGPFTRRCQAFLERALGVPRVLLTTSCTHALEMAALLLRIEPGDEVVVPSFTFVSTANAFAMRGARPVFADIRPDTLNLDESQLQDLITPRTRAVAPVHYAGVGCDMTVIGKISRRHGLAVVEDNAHGLFGRHKGRHLGTYGQLATLSFHETKNFTCGEGGALLINEPAYVERAEILREKGTDRSRFFRGQVDKYSWVDLGSSYGPSDLLAAFLLAQLEAADSILSRRGRIWHRYRDGLRQWALEHGVALPHIPPDCQQPFHMFYLLLPSPGMRQALIEHLKSRGIMAVFHYQPLHLSPMGLRYGGRPGQCPVTERVSQQLLRLPFYTGLSEDDQELVISSVREFAPGEGARELPVDQAVVCGPA